MTQFSEFIRGGEVVRDVKQKYPQTAAIFEEYGLRPSCDDCSIELSARKVGASLADLLTGVNEAIYANPEASAPGG